MKVKIFRGFIKFLKLLLFSVFSAIIIYFVFAVLFSFLRTIPPEQNCNPTKEIFITSNGVHLDIVLPVENVPTEFLKKLDILKGTKYISYGWGDQEFYVINTAVI